MDQKVIDRAVKVAQQWNVFRPITEAGFSPSQIKEAIIGVLNPHFLNKDLLEEYSIELLSAEAFRVIKIKQDVWAESAFNHVAGIYRAAETVDAAACYKACAESERAVLTAASEHWSLLYLELDKYNVPPKLDRSLR